MRALFIPTHKSRMWVQVAALVLLVVALVIPQFTWADHAADHPDNQLNSPASLSASAAYDALVEQYKAGTLAYHAPGRRDDRSFSSSASAAYAALVEKYKSGELVFHAPGRRDDRSFSNSSSEAITADTARWAALGSYYLAKSDPERAAAADTARWAALGAHYAEMGAASLYLAANPELSLARRSYAAGSVGQFDTAYLAANPEMRAYWAYLGQNGCSVSGQAC